jgi:hypothetical protein
VTDRSDQVRLLINDKHSNSVLVMYSAFTENVDCKCHFPDPASKCYNVGS